MSYWVAMTKASSENLAEHHLKRQGFIPYLPRYLSRIGKEIKVKILFPRYLFIKEELQWHSIHGTRGITRLLMRESTPAVIPDKIIENLRMKEDHKGFISLPEPPKFRSGEKVRVVNGSLEGYSALYDGMRPNERARVLIDMLGQQIQVELDEKDLVLAVASDGKG